MKMILGVVFVVCSLGFGKVKGDSVGNGELIRCFQADGSFKDVLLDYYEAKKKNPAFQLVTEKLPGDAMAKASYVIGEIEKVDAVRGAFYRTKLDLFESSIQEQDGPLGDPKDTGELQLPPECKILQLALQRPKAFPTDKPYVIDRKLWAELTDEAQRAGLILHEIIYSEALALGHEDSVLARMYHRFVTDVAFETASIAEYEALASKVFIDVHVEFKSRRFYFKAPPGSVVGIDLLALMKSTNFQSITWFTDANMPGWLKLESSKNMITGVPGDSDRGETMFRIVAERGKTSAIAEVFMTVD